MEPLNSTHLYWPYHKDRLRYTSFGVRQWFIKKYHYWSLNASGQNNLRYPNLFRCDSINFTIFFRGCTEFHRLVLKKLIWVQNSSPWRGSHQWSSSRVRHPVIELSSTRKTYVGECVWTYVPLYHPSHVMQLHAQIKSGDYSMATLRY